MLLKGDGAGPFRYIDQQQSGLHLREDVRTVVPVGGGEWLFGINGEGVRAYRKK